MNPTPLPGNGTHDKCRYPDAEILLDDVRRTRQWRSWLITGGLLFVVTTLLAIFGWLFSVGTEVGSAQRELQHIERDVINGQVERNEIRREQIKLERDNSVRYQKIQDSLHKIENNVGRLEQSVEDMRPRRRR